jgi:uncharacterized protein (TIGR02246 family)
VADRSAPDPELNEAIEAFDRAFSEGQLDELLAFFASDAQLLIHQQEAVIGREAIRSSFAGVFDDFDTSSYETRYDVIDVHGDRAYALASFDEVLRPQDGRPGIRIHGRVVHFWRREREGTWRITRLLTSRSAPDESEP